MIRRWPDWTFNNRVLVLIPTLTLAAASFTLAGYALAQPGTYDAGYEAGQRDLCGEMGGTHVVEDATYSWCDR